ADCTMCVCDRSLALTYRCLLRFELEGQFIDLAGELERRIVAILNQRNPGSSVLADVEALILRECDRDGVLQCIFRHLLAIYQQYAGATFAQTRTVGFDIEHDGVLARGQLRYLPHRALEVEQVVEEHNLSTVESKFPLAQKQAIATKASALSNDHAFCAAFGNVNFSSDGVALVQDARCCA